jgi:hypothetical protein
MLQLKPSLIQVTPVRRWFNLFLDFFSTITVRGGSQQRLQQDVFDGRRSVETGVFRCEIASNSTPVVGDPHFVRFDS